MGQLELRLVPERPAGPPEISLALPEPVARSRRAPLVATLAAGAGLVVIETVYALAERWNHAPLYFALSAGLTLALALVAGLVPMLLRRGPWEALALLAGSCIGFSFGWPWGLAVGALALGVAQLSRARRAPPAVLGTCVALALACAWLKCPALAEHLGRKDERLIESIGAVVLFAVVLAGLPLALSYLPPRGGPAARVLGLLLLGCTCALRPCLERGHGEQRLPPPGYASSTPRSAGPRGPDVFVLVLDTVRADHLSLYGYERETTPELARRVQERENAVVFRHAYANGTWTVPSHASLFTGRLPNEHGAHFALDGSVRYGFGISDSLATLAEQMKAGGYATLAGFANHWLRSMGGMGRGFDRYLRAPDHDKLPFVGEALRELWMPGLCWEPVKGAARANEVNATLLSMIEPWSQGPNPLYVFANYADAHGPYAPPAPFRGRFAAPHVTERAEHLSLAQSLERRATLKARYDEEIASLDHELGQFFDELERMGLLDRSWVFVTADHGEAFGEHGALEHGTTVHDEVTHVPLLVFPPAGERLEDDGSPVSLVDVAATVAAIGGVDLGGPGRDLRQPRTRESVVAIEFYGDPYKAATLGDLARHPARAVIVGTHKLIALEDQFFLFDLERDPGEHVNLARAAPELVERLKALLPEFRAPTFRSDRDAPTPEALDALRGLGYAGGQP